MIGKALLKSSRTVAIHFLFDLFPVPVSGSKMSVSGYCSYFLFPPATRFWSVILFLFYTLNTTGYTTYISYFWSIHHEIPQAAEDESCGRRLTCSGMEKHWFGEEFEAVHLYKDEQQRGRTLMAWEHIQNSLAQLLNERKQ